MLFKKLSVMSFMILLTILTSLLHQRQIRGQRFYRSLMAINTSFSLAQDANKIQADTLFNRGIQHFHNNQVKKAIETWKQALVGYQKLKNLRQQAKILGNLGAAHHILRQYDQAKLYYQESQKIAEIIDDRQTIVNALRNLSFVYLSVGEYQKAINYGKKSLEIAENLSAKADTLGKLGSAYMATCQYDLSLEYHQKHLDIARKIKDHQNLANALGNLGNLYRILNKPLEALDYHGKNLEIARELKNDRRGEANVLGNIGLAYHTLANYSEAEKYHQQSLQLAKDIGDRQLEGKTIGNLGSVYYRYGQYTKAIQHHQKYLNIAEQMKDLQGQVSALGNLGNDYNALGQPIEAMKYLQGALKIARKIGDCRSEGGALNGLGLSFQDLGSYQKAIEYFEQSLELAQKHQDERGKGHVVGNLGTTYLEWGIRDKNPEYYQKALEYYEQKLEIVRKSKDFRSEGAVLTNMGIARTKLGDYEAAADSFRQARRLLQEIGDRDAYGQAVAGTAFLHQQLGDADLAIVLYKEAIEIKETIRSQLMVGAFKSSFEERQIDTYKQIIKLLWDRGDKQEAFNYVERARAKTFLDQLANGQIDFRSQAEPELLKQEQDLQGKKITKRNKLMALKNRDENDQDKKEIAEVEAELTKIETEYTNLLTKIELQHPEVASLVSLQPRQLLSLAQIQEKLAKDTTLIEYFVTKDHTFAFVITANSFDSIEIKVQENQLKEALKKFDQSDPRKKNPHRKNSHPEALLKLHEWLIEPLPKTYLSASTSNLIIAPHGILHYVPFAGLTDGKKYLIDRYNLSTLPSANVLNFIDKKNSVKDESPTPGNSIIEALLSKLNDLWHFLWGDRNFSKKILILGNPEIDVSLPKLVHAQDEAKNIAQLYRGKALVNREATEIVVHSKAHQAEILHLAAHGEYNNRNPLFSNIYLAKDESDKNKEKLGKNNGLLEVHEVYGLNLEKASLVVLSACKTKIGDLSKGDEIVGLNRAFIYAGTPTVIASLWSVEDQSTRLIMEQFHTYLRQGMEKAKALRLAQKALRENHPHYSHPYYWAAFSLTGDGGKF